MTLLRPHSRRALRLGVVTAAVTAVVALGSPATATPDEGQILRAGGPTAVADSYIVVLKETVVARAGVTNAARDLAGRHGGTVARTYQHALRGFEARLSAAAAGRLAADPSVRYVEQNHTVKISGTQSPTPSWGLDRINQRNPPLNNSYTYPNTGSVVRAYVIDTGIRFSHADFGGRAVSGFDAIDGGTADDCNGHGTHVSGTVGGTAYGVAKHVTLVGVRVLDCGGEGTWAQVISGVDWVTGDHDPGEPAVANMSLGGAFAQAINDAVTASIADGVSYGVAAGNDDGSDACEFSPAGTPNAITVGATTNTDARANYSNAGTCLDIFAPGSGITSAWNLNDFDQGTANGTSMASPHVVGAAAMVLAANPSYSPLQVRDKLVNDATSGVLTNPGPGSPNKLLYVGNIPESSRDFSIAVSSGSGVAHVGGALTATVSTTTTLGSSQTVNLSAHGLPSGATASFSPSSITSGSSATMTISVTSATAAGSYPVTIMGRGTVTTQTTGYALTISGNPGCSQANGTDVMIPDLGTVESSITVSGCSGNAGTASLLEVHISYAFIGDLNVTLVAPDGSSYPLEKDRGTLGYSLFNIDHTFLFDLSGEVANGTWKLRVQDRVKDELGMVGRGFISGIAFHPRGAVSDCATTNGADVTIPDLGTVESSITVSGCTGNASSASLLEVHIAHTARADLIVTLVAPDGSTYPLHKQTGGNYDNIDTGYTVDLSGEARNGIWKLRVQDVNPVDAGHVDSWTLSLGDPPMPWWTVVDNSSTSFRASRSWPGTSMGSPQRYGPDYRFANPEPISDPAWYSADLPATGTYQMEAWYPATSTNNDHTPYVIVTSAGNRTVHVDQRSTGGRWVSLGTFPMTGGAHDVVGVSRWTSGTGYVIADAIRIIRVS